MTTQRKQPEVPVQPVDQPIICNPYDEPNDHWIYDTETGGASRAGFRREAGYWYKTERTGLAQQELFAEEERDDLPLVNLLRKDVRRWREAGYRGASNVSRALLHHWASPKLPRRLFFCQREAVETIIYLAELRIPGRSSRTGFKKFALSDDNLARLLRGEKPSFEQLARTDFFPMLIDQPADPNLLPLRRLGCKMATGSGKTVVMAMLISWAFCNRGLNPASTLFPNAVLVCCPNLTVKERLQVLRPEDPHNYYSVFDLVPVKYRPLMQFGKVLVENWHRFSPESEHKEGDKTYAVVDKGLETPETLGRRVLGDLYDRLPIMVLNDEGHHCWRPKPVNDDLSTEEKKQLKEEAEEARVWLSGLDMLNNCRSDGKPGISMCVDLSATPFFIKGSGYPEGQPFPWLVSDFGLVDAIESGIVKIPRLPVKDDQAKKDEAGRPDPKYFRLWHNISSSLKPGEKLSSGKPKAEVVYREIEGALKQIAGQWVERYKYLEENNPNVETVPPALIIVCDNTDIAQIVYEKLSGEREEEIVTEDDLEAAAETDDNGKKSKRRTKKSKKQITYGRGAIFPEYFSNTPTEKHTIRIDTKLLAAAESEDPNKTTQQAAEELRRIVATVGKKGQPGEFVRCVVSVSMLTEGWDANNVTHVLGIRAFGSQLLCEQVVGRGLRRMNYEPDPETGLLTEEYVDVYGIPFSVIPFKGRPVNKPTPEDKPKHRVWAIPSRQEDMEIRFPIVEGYVFALRKNLLKCHVDSIEPLTIDPKLEPVTTFLRPSAGYLDGKVHENAFEFVKQDRAAYYSQTHFQTILFQITQQIVDELLAPTSRQEGARARVFRLQSRHQLFPQVLAFVTQYVRRKVNFNGVDPRELGLEKYMRLVVERIRDAVFPDDSAGEAPILPILNRYRPTGSTSNVDFPTTRPVTPVTKSHINLVVQHSNWEPEAAQLLEASDIVQCFARNDHLGLLIPYEYLHVDHTYEPDFIVRLVNDVHVILEIKGYEFDNEEQNNQKHNAAKKWCTAVNNLGDFGRWEFLVCRDLDLLIPRVTELLSSHPGEESPKEFGR